MNGIAFRNYLTIVFTISIIMKYVIILTFFEMTQHLLCKFFEVQRLFTNRHFI